jgi:drug/metabolite transporter (DMT)-like permease
MKAWKIDHLKMFLIPTTIFTMMLFCSLQALPYIAVATTIIFRNIGTVLVATGDYFFFSKVFTFQQRFAMGIIICGSVVYAGSDVNYEPIGYFWITLNTLFFSGNMLIESWVVKEIDQVSQRLSESTVVKDNGPKDNGSSRSRSVQRSQCTVSYTVAFDLLLAAELNPRP